MKKRANKIMSFLMALFMIMEFISPSFAALASEEEEPLDPYKISNLDKKYGKEPNSEFSIELASKLDNKNLESKEKLSIALTSTADNEDIKLLVRRDMSLYKQAYYEDYDKAQEEFDKLNKKYTDQGLQAQLNLIEEDGKYTISNPQDESEEYKEFGSAYKVYDFKVIKDFDFENKGLHKKLNKEGTENYQRAYLFDFYIEKSIDQNLNMLSLFKEENTPITVEHEGDLLAGIFDDKYYSLYDTSKVYDEVENSLSYKESIKEEKEERSSKDSSEKDTSFKTEENNTSDEEKEEDTEDNNKEETSVDNSNKKKIAKRSLPDDTEASGEDRLAPAGSWDNFSNKKFILQTTMQVKAQPTSPVPAGWYFDLDIGDYLKEGNNNLETLLDKTGQEIASPKMLNERTIRYTFLQKISNDTDIDINQSLDFNVDKLKEQTSNLVDINISIKPKGMPSNTQRIASVAINDNRTEIPSTGSFNIEGSEEGQISTAYPYKLEVSSSQTMKDGNGQDVSLMTGIPSDLQAWWDFEIDTSPLADQGLDFKNLNISLFGSNKQGLQGFTYKIAKDKKDLDFDGGYQKSGLTGSELMTAKSSWDKSNLGDKLYIRVKAPVSTYHNNYSIGLRINPDSNYVQKILDDFIKEFESLPYIFKYMKGVEKARQVASTPFNLVDNMYVNEVGITSPYYKENFYFDNTRTIVANRINKTTTEWHALDLIRIGESEDPNLESATTNPRIASVQKVYFIPNIDGTYKRSVNRNDATMADGSFKPGVIVSYTYPNQKGNEATNYKFDVNLKEKITDFSYQIENTPDAPTEGGSKNLYTQKYLTDPTDPQGNMYLSYFESPYSIMRIDKNFDMVECFNADLKDPTLSHISSGVYLDKHLDPTGSYLLTRLDKSSPLPKKLLPGAELNKKGLNQGEAMEDLLKRIYYYADLEKEEYAKTHDGKVMHRLIEAGMRQKVIHYFTNGKPVEYDYWQLDGGTPINDTNWQNNHTLIAGKLYGGKWDLNNSFIGEKGANAYKTDPPGVGIRKLSPGEEAFGLTPFVPAVQTNYAKDLVNKVLASYDNDDWENEKRANSVQLVFYSHTQELQELIGAHVVKPITIDKKNSDGKKLKGAKFTLTNKATGERTTFTSSDNSSENKLYLKEGSYIVTETDPPKENGNDYDIIAPFSLEVKREEINPDDGHFPKYALFAKDKKKIHVNDGYKEKIELGKDLPKGVDGKALVKLSNNSLTVEIEDPDSNLGEIEFSKKSYENKNTNRLLDGAEFSLTKIKSKNDTTADLKADGSNVYKQISSGLEGKFKFKAMPVGFYLLEETKVPAGYKKASNRIIEVTAPTDGSKKLIARFLDEQTQESKAILNEPIKINIDFIKTNGEVEENKKLDLSGAKFRLYSISTIGNSPYDETVFSGDKGAIKFENLTKGEYILEELVPPQGYQLPKDLPNEKDRFFGWKLVVDEVSGKEVLTYKLYKLKTKDDAKKPIDQLEEIDKNKDGIFEIANKGRTIDVEFQKYIENPNFDELIGESSTNPRYIPIDTGKLIRKSDNKPVSFNLYESDFYGAKLDADHGKEGVNPVLENVTADDKGVFHLNGLKFNGYYILEETKGPDGYQLANPIVLRVVAEALTSEGQMKVIVRDPNLNALMKNGNTFAGVVDFLENERPGKVTIKKTGLSLDESHQEVGLRRAYFRLYFADQNFKKKKNNEGFEDYIQKVSAGIPLTKVDPETGKPILDEEGKEIPLTPEEIEKLSPDQGLVVFDQLKPGFYILEEYRGPAGYEKDPNPWYIQVKTDGTVVKSRDINDPNFLKTTLDTTVSSTTTTSGLANLIRRPLNFFANTFASLGENLLGNTEADSSDREAAGEVVDGSLASISIEGSEINTEEGSRDVKITLKPKLDVKESEPNKVHLLLMLDRSKSNQDKTKPDVDDNINKFLTDLNKKAKETNTDVDITFVEYGQNYSNNVGTYNLKDLNENVREYPYTYAWYAEGGGGVYVDNKSEQIKDYLSKVGVRPLQGELDGSKKLKENLPNYLNQINQYANDHNRKYDSKIAVNFVKLKTSNLSQTGTSFDIISNMETLQENGYDTWTYHTDLYYKIFYQLSAKENAYTEAIDKFREDYAGKAEYAYRYVNTLIQEKDASLAPYVQKGFMDELLTKEKYFSIKPSEKTSKVKNANLRIHFASNLIVVDKDTVELKKYKGQGQTESLEYSLTKSGNGQILTVNNLSLDEDQYLILKFKSKLHFDAGSDQYKIFDQNDGISLSTKDANQVVKSGLYLYKETQNRPLVKPEGVGKVEIKFDYSNYPDSSIPKDKQAGSIKIQRKYKNEWFDILVSNEAGNRNIIKADAPFEGSVSFDGLGLEQNNEKIEYRIVYTRNSPYYSDWGVAEVSKYDVKFDKDNKATINISNGNLIKVFNKNEDGFRIPLRITKLNDNKTVLTGSTFKARKIINGQEVNGKKPKYADDAFDAVTEATGLAGDNYFRELTPGIYEMWEEVAPNGYKKLEDKWFFKVSVDPNKQPGDANYMYIDFQFDYKLPEDINDPKYNNSFREYYNSQLASQSDKKLPGTTIYGLDYGNKKNKDIDQSLYEKFIQNIELVEDDGRSNPARPDAPYATINDAHVYNHKETGDLVFNKVNSKGKSIEGAVFTLTKIKADEAGKPLLTEAGKPDPEMRDGRPVYMRYQTSSYASGVKFEQIPEGVYALEEFSPAPGYKKINSYLIIKFKDNGKGVNEQVIDIDNSDPEFVKLINTKNHKLISVENENNFTKLVFNKVDADGKDLSAVRFTLEEVNEKGEKIENGYYESFTNYNGENFEFTNLKEGRYRLTENPLRDYEMPTPWYFKVVADKEKGTLNIEFEDKGSSTTTYETDPEASDKSAIKNEDGTFSLVNYKKISFKFIKLVKIPGQDKKPISDVWFSLKKVRTEASDNGKQLYDTEGHLIESLRNYQYEAIDRSGRDGSVDFDNLTSGVYELRETTKIKNLKANSKDRWILKVIKDEGGLKVVYDKSYEKDYYLKNDKDYHDKIYDEDGNLIDDSFELDENKVYKLTNTLDEVDLKWKKVDSKFLTLIEKEEDKAAKFKAYKISENPDDLTNLNISKDDLDNVEGVDDLSKEINSYRGYYELLGLQEGLYKIVETSPPEGYDKSDRSFLAQVKAAEDGKLKVKYYEIDNNSLLEAKDFKYISVDENKDVSIDEAGYIKIKNTPSKDNPRGTLKINKTDNNGKALANARFALIGEDGQIKKEADSDSQGKVVFIDIEKGTYTLIESSAPKGYDLTNKRWRVDVLSDGKTFIQEIGQEAPHIGNYEGKNVTDKVILDTGNSSVTFNDTASGGIANNGRLEMDTGENAISVKMHMDINGEVNPGDYFVIKESDTLHYNMTQPDKPNYPNITDGEGNVIATWGYGSNFNMEKGTGKDIYYVFTDYVKEKSNISMDMLWAHSVNLNVAYNSGTYEFSVSLGEKKTSKNIEIAYLPHANNRDLLSINANYLYTNDQSGRYTQIAYINPNKKNISGSSKILVYPAVKSGVFNMADLNAIKAKLSLYKLKVGPDEKVSDTVIFDRSKLEEVDSSKYEVEYIGKQEGQELVNAAQITLNEPIGSNVYLLKVDSEMLYPPAEDKRPTMLGQWVELENSDSKPSVRKSNAILTNVSVSIGHGQDDYQVPEIDVENSPHIDKKGSFEIDKQDDLGASLPGARFTLTPTNPKGDPIERVSGIDGKVSFDNLDQGTYELKESASPQGFKENDDTWTVVVDENGATQITKDKSLADRVRSFANRAIGNITSPLVSLFSLGSTNLSSDRVAEERAATGAFDDKYDETIGNTIDKDFAKTHIKTKATALGDGQYQIDMDIRAGEDETQGKDADVVFVLSAYNLAKDADAKKALVEKINSYGEGTRVGLVIYSTKLEKTQSLTNKKTVADLINNFNVNFTGAPNVNQVKNALAEAKTYLGEGGNTDKEVIFTISNSLAPNNNGLINTINDITNMGNIHTYYRSGRYKLSVFNESMVNNYSKLTPITDLSGLDAEGFKNAIPYYGQTRIKDVEKAKVNISFNSNFTFVDNSLVSNKGNTGEDSWASFDGKMVKADSAKDELTLDANNTAHLSFKVKAKADIEAGDNLNLVDSITFKANDKAQEYNIASPTVSLKEKIKNIKVSIRSEHSGAESGKISFTLKRRGQNGEDSSFERKDSIDTNSTKEYNLPISDQEGNLYEYYVANLSSDNNNIGLENPTTSVRGADGTILINSKDKDKFKVALNWSNLERKGDITLNLSNGKEITIKANEDNYETYDYDPSTVTIQSASIVNPKYTLQILGESSPYTINVIEKSNFVINLDWFNINPLGEVTIKVGGKTIKLNKDNRTYSSSDLDPEKVKLDPKDVSFDREGYKLEVASENGKSPYTIRISKDDEVSKITVVNTKSPRGSFQIRKTDESEKKNLEGAVFILYKADQNFKKLDEVKRASSNKSGLASFTNLLEGNYILEENKAPDNYLKTDKTWKISVDKEGAVKVSEVTPESEDKLESQTDLVLKENNEFIVVNKEKTTDLALIKKDFDKGFGLSGAEFSLYKLKEGRNPSSSLEDDEKKAQDDQNFELVKVTNTEGDKVDSITTDQEGKINFKDIADGLYYVKEIRPPKAYEKGKETYGPITIKDGKIEMPKESPSKEKDYYELAPSNGETKNTITIYNKKIEANLPYTGSKGILIFTIFGLIIMLFAGYVYNRKREVK